MSWLRNLSFGILGLVVCLNSAGCSTTLWRVGFVKPAEHQDIPAKVPFLKCHLRSGEVFVFSNWEIHEDSRMISGNGLHYTSVRRLAGKGTFELPLSRVVLFETDQPESVMVHSQYAVMTALSVISLTLSAVMLALLLG
jgi:hypothetical protein